jgi:hypothetical protein
VPGSATSLAAGAPDEVDELEALETTIFRSLGALVAEEAAGDIEADLATAHRAADRARLAALEAGRTGGDGAAAAAGGEDELGGVGASTGGSASSVATADDASRAKLEAAASQASARLAAAVESRAGASDGSGLTLATVPKPVSPSSLAAHEAGLAQGGAVVPEASPRVKPRWRRLRRARAEEATGALLDEAAARGVSPAEALDDARPWADFGYAAAPDYRAPGAHTLLHRRLLEAADAHDLEAMFAIWAAHARMAPQVSSGGRGEGAQAGLHPIPFCVRHRHSPSAVCDSSPLPFPLDTPVSLQEGAPDFLALEILMDGCARARRWDLLEGYLWKTVNRLNMQARRRMKRGRAMD